MSGGQLNERRRTMLFFSGDEAVAAYCSDTEPYAKVRDAEIRALAEADGLTVETPCGHTLHDPALLLKLCKGKMPITYKVPPLS